MNSRPSRLSPDFLPATFRGATAAPDGPIDAIGLSFDGAGGEVHRFRLSNVDALALLRGVARYQGRMNSHNDKSSGRPSREGSPQEGQKV